MTLIGPGGAGKTRVAIEAGGRSIADFPGGAYFVDLTTLTDSASVLPAFVDGLARAVPPDRTAAQHIIAALGAPPAIVVVDNCERVLDAIADFVEELLAAAPGVRRVLATSRVPLELTEEHTIASAPARCRDGRLAGGAAVRRASVGGRPGVRVRRRGAGDRRPDPTRRLDGMPLAIELAAARIRTLTPTQILANLDDRFRLLVRGAAQRRATGQPRGDHRLGPATSCSSWRSSGRFDHSPSAVGR